MRNSGSLYINARIPNVGIVEFLRWRSTALYGDLADRIEDKNILNGETILHHRNSGHLHILFDEYQVKNSWHRAYLQRDIELAVQGASAYKIQCMYRSVCGRSLFAVVLLAHRKKVRAARVVQRAYREMKQRRITNFLQLAKLTVNRRRVTKAANFAMEKAAASRVAFTNSAMRMTSIISGDKTKTQLMGFVRKVINGRSEATLIVHLRESVQFLESNLAGKGLQKHRKFDMETILKPLKATRTKYRVKGIWSDAVDEEYRRFVEVLRLVSTDEGSEEHTDNDTIASTADMESNHQEPHMHSIQDSMLEDCQGGNVTKEEEAEEEGKKEGYKHREDEPDVQQKIIQNHQRDNSLIQCCMEGGYASRMRVRCLVEVSKADVNFATHDWRGNTPLHYAAMSGDADMCKLLISLGADIERRNRDGGNTALHLAFLVGEPLVAEVLMKAGASYKVKNRAQGLTPQEMIDYRNGGGTVSIIASTFRKEARLIRGKIPIKRRREPSCQLQDLRMTWVDSQLRNKLAEHVEEMDAIADAETVVTDTSSEADTSTVSTLDVMPQLSSMGQALARRASNAKLGLAGISRPHFSSPFFRHKELESPDFDEHRQVENDVILEERSDESSTASSKSSSSRSSRRSTSTRQADQSTTSSRSRLRNISLSASGSPRVHPKENESAATDTSGAGGGDVSVVSVDDPSAFSGPTTNTIVSGLSSKAPQWEEKGRNTTLL